MANLTNLNNKFLVTTGGAVLINQTSAVSTHLLTLNGRMGGPTFSDSYLQFTGGNLLLKANDDVKLGYTQNVVVKQSGSVGIGTTSPAAKLHVTGDTGGADSIVRFQNTNSTAKSTRIQLLDSAGNVGDALIAYDHSNASSALHYLGMGVNNSTTLVINNNDNVGIGTTSPATKLQVANAGEVIVRSSMTAADGYRGGFEADNQHTGGTIWSMFSTNNSDGYFGGGKFVIANESMGSVDANTTGKFIIDGSGNVGIGTTSPAQKLEVVSSGFAYVRTRSTASSFTGFDIGQHTGGSIYLNNRDDTPIIFQTNNTERMRIKEDGVITFSTTGNTTTPAGSINHASNNFLYVTGGTGGASFGDDSHATRMIIHDNDSVRFDTGGSERMRIDSSGNVGIGTTNPSNLLSLVKTSGDCVLGLTGNASGDPEIHMNSGNNRSGNIKYGDGSTAAMFRYQHSDVAFKFYAHNQTNVDFQIGENTSFFANCNLGIGTTSPNQTGYSTDSKVVTVKAPVSGGASALELIGLANADGNLAGAVNFMSYAETAPLAQITGVRHTADTAGKLYFKTSGNTVLSMLQDQTAYFYNTLYFSNSGVGSISWGSMAGGTGFGIRGESGRGLSLGSNGAWDKMIIDTNGKVGINTTTPYGRLDVYGSLTVGAANQDPGVTLTETGDDVSMTAAHGGSIEVIVPMQGTTTNGCTLTFTYAATSWKSWILDYEFASTDGMVKGVVGGYNNNSTGNGKTQMLENFPTSVAVSNSGQHVIVTFTFSSGMGIHPLARFIYSQGGGDGTPRADRVTVAYVEGS